MHDCLCVCTNISVALEHRLVGLIIIYVNCVHHNEYSSSDFDHRELSISNTSYNC